MSLRKKTKSSLFKKIKKITKKVNIPRDLLNKLIGLFLIVLALFVLTYKPPAPRVEIVREQKEPIVIDSKLQESKATDNIPVRVLIPTSDIDLPIIPSEIVNGYWELSETTASYGLGSGTPGENGNTVIFAHAREGLFYNLKDVKKGGIIYVFTKDKWYRYKIDKITEVLPNQTEVIQPTKNETLTLYTCSGFYDEKRLIVSAVREN